MNMRLRTHECACDTYVQMYARRMHTRTQIRAYKNKPDVDGLDVAWISTDVIAKYDMQGVRVKS